MRFAITQPESLLNIIDTTPLGFISHSSAFPQIFYQKLDSARFPFLISKCSEVVAKGNRRFFPTGGCETSWTTGCLTEIYYLSSKIDKLEVLNTTRSDIPCISALFLQKT